MTICLIFADDKKLRYPESHTYGIGNASCFIKIRSDFVSPGETLTVDYTSEQYNPYQTVV
jgi:hypothetical protein